MEISYIDSCGNESDLLNALPSLPLESVIKAYLANGARDAASDRAARLWVASHWRMSRLPEFGRAAKALRDALTPPSVVAAGVRVYAWEGFKGRLSTPKQVAADDIRGSVTLVVGSPGASGKSVTARFLETRMLCEMNRMRGGDDDTPLAEARIDPQTLDWGDIESSISEIIPYLNDRSRMHRTLLVDGHKILHGQWLPRLRGSAKMARIADMARESGIHIVMVPSLYEQYDAELMSRIVDRIVITAGVKETHRDAAGALAPLVGMEAPALVAMLKCMRPFARLVFERRLGSRAGIVAFTPETTIVSIAGGLTGFYPSAVDSVAA